MDGTWRVDRQRAPRGADCLQRDAATAGIDYRRIAGLGGLRGHRRSDPPSPNGQWENASFRNDADYAETDAFRAGLAELRALGRTRRCAIVCAEVLWGRCHRRIIADDPMAAGEHVVHILGPGKSEPAAINAAARETAEGALVYPPPAAGRERDR